MHQAIRLFPRQTHLTLLAQEYKEQAASRTFTIKRLVREKQHWFAGGKHILAFSLSQGAYHCVKVSRPPSLFLL
jgi:THO complex subunit 2